VDGSQQNRKVKSKELPSDIKTFYCNEVLNNALLLYLVQPNFIIVGGRHGTNDSFIISLTIIYVTTWL